MATLAEQVSKLLDFDQKLDITLLDSIVGCMYSGAGEQVSLLLSKILLFHTQHSILIYFFEVLFNASMFLLFPLLILKESNFLNFYFIFRWWGGGCISSFS